MTSPKTIDFLLKEDGGVFVGTVTLKGGEPHPFVFEPLAPEEEAILQAMRHAIRNREQNRPSNQELVQLGRAFYRRLFETQAAHTLLPEDFQAQIRLQIESAQLQSWPWEMMHDGEDWLFRDRDRPVIRRLPKQDVDPVTQSSNDCRIEVHGVATTPDNPTGKELNIQVIAERIKSMDAIKTAMDQKLLHLNITKGTGDKDSPHIDDLLVQLEKSPTILSVICHGEPGKLHLNAPPTGLWASTEKVDAKTMNALFHDSPPPLVLIAACESSSLVEDGALIAEGFVQALAAESPRIGALVGMQFIVGEYQIAEFLAIFFSAVASHLPVERAFAIARRSLVDDWEKIPLTAFSPVLYSRLEDGVILVPKWERYDGITQSETEKIVIPNNQRVDVPLFSGQQLVLHEHVKLEESAYGRAGVEMGSGASCRAGVVSGGPISIGDYSEVNGRLLSLVGECTIGNACDINGDLICTGPVTVGDGCEIGSIFTDGAVTLGRYCHVGSIRAQRVTMGEACRVRIIDLVDPQADAPPAEDGWFPVPQDQVNNADYRRFVRTDFAVAGTADRLLAPGSLPAYQRVDELLRRLS